MNFIFYFRLQYAQRLFNAGIERSPHPDLCNAREWLKKTERALQDAKKDNDFIYHERIPEERALSTIAKAAVAKPTALPEKFGNMDKTLFDNLVPVVVHQALASFDVRKKEIINRELARIKEATNLVNAAMASMNLPAAIESSGAGNELPQSLREKSQKIIDAGGPDTIKKLINELPGNYSVKKSEIFLSLRFYVKSILENLKEPKVPFQFEGLRILLLLSFFSLQKMQKIKITILSL